MSGLCNKHVTMKYGILASPHASFGFLLSFFRPCRQSSKDGKRSFVPFAIVVDGEIYRVHVLEPMSYVLCT